MQRARRRGFAPSRAVFTHAAAPIKARCLIRSPFFDFDTILPDIFRYGRRISLFAAAF